MKFKLLIFILTVCVYNKQTDEGLEEYMWPKKFKQDFDEDMKYWVLHGSTSGTIYYNWDLQKYRIDRENGKWDRYCGAVQYFRNTPCTHYVDEGIRYLYYEKLNYCCACCTAESGCGILKYDWLKGAEKVKEYTQGNDNFTVWNQKGLQDNLVTVKNGKEMTEIDQQPNDLMHFKNFDTDFDDSLLELPQICRNKQKCPTVSVCSFV